MKNINQNALRERTKAFIQELNLPISRFAKRIGIARESYYRWQKGDFNFGEQRAEQIDKYLQRYGF